MFEPVLRADECGGSEEVDGVREMNFDQLFRQISPEEISDNVFTLVGKVFPVITAGKEDHFNSMTASGGGLGMLFKKPTTWCIEIGINQY
ncbi:MAG: hypothetical protein P4L35_06355 [Ignavibacteriaceae bacterium]|nr:hypothetical protein [Ignavibacteriaceae bacterium]